MHPPPSATSTALLASALLCVACARADFDGPIRHVLLISLDTTRADQLGCYGGPAATPSIDRLAGEGVRFANVLAPAPTTLASTTSIMTGCYPQTHGVPRNGFVVNEENHMLAEILRDAGFHTAGFLGSFALERRFEFNQGFEHFDEDFDLLVNLEGGHDQNQRRADEVTDAVLRHLDALDEDRLFLFVHYFDAHQPYDPPAPFDTAGKATAADIGESIVAHQTELVAAPPGVSGVIDQGLSVELIQGANGEPDEGDERLARLYAAEIGFMDSQIGRLLDELDRRGILDETLVVVTGDHGESFWEHADFWNHGLWVYGTTVNVPLILRFPRGANAGCTVAEPVSTVDLVPTLCELLGLPMPERSDGVSLVAPIEDRPFRRGTIFSQATQPYTSVERRGTWRNAYKAQCARNGHWKYVRAPYLPYEQLFDLGSDPLEQNDLLRTPDALSSDARRAWKELGEELSSWASSAAPLPSHFDTTQAEETMERLEALGYGGK